MSSINGDGKGNLLISYLFKSNNVIKQVNEEAELKVLIKQLLINKGYKFSIADDDVINKRLINSGWISVSERLPTKEEYNKDDGRFIVTDGNRVYQSLFDIHESKCFIDVIYKGNCNFEETIDNRVIAWQVLPEIYKEDLNE